MQLSPGIWESNPTFAPVHNNAMPIPLSQSPKFVAEAGLEPATFGL
jgi:hypothetical protein